ncbi:MAG: asparagine synthase (glutamine-hydrolyzing), partial [Aggregatilineales bacterium]
MVDLTGAGRADPALARRMADRIRHRGPDGDGFYHAPGVALGMRRLSIIDVAGSDQPLYNEDGSVALVFNGEIYNYRELRAELVRSGHALRTAGDGETLVHLYEEHGLRLFDHLRGMYAFALWDSRARRLLLAVDHIGMKPLYLHERGGLLYFASEVKAFYADPDMPRRLNTGALDAYMGFGYMIGPETLFEGVRRLPPGHALLVESGTQTLRSFWTFGAAASAPLPGGAGAIVEQARDLLTEAVRLHLRSDVPLGLFLSGGVDSAAVLALMAQEAGGRIQTYTIGYDMDAPDNELAQARQVAAHFATQHHERVISADEWWEGFERYVYAHDEPNANPSAVSLLLLAEMTAQHVKVVLTGLGGDELFCGYPNHRTIARALRAQASWGRALRPLAGLLGALEPHYP